MLEVSPKLLASRDPASPFHVRADIPIWVGDFQAEFDIKWRVPVLDGPGAAEGAALFAGGLEHDRI